MPFKNSFLFCLICVLVAVNNNCFEYLSNHGVKASQTLFFRGIFTLVVCFVIGIVKKESVVPTAIKQQAIRFFTTGGSLLLILLSYVFISAGTISLLQRLDIPFLIFVSAISKKNKPLYQILLSALVVVTILVLTINPTLINEDINGYLLAFGSVLMTAIGYITVHKGSKKESVPALINVAATSSIFFGCIIIISNADAFVLPTTNFVVIGISSVINVILFYITVALYKQYEPERALLPFVLAIVSTSVLEMIIEQKIYNTTDIIITLGLTIVISAICMGGRKLSNSSSS